MHNACLFRVPVVFEILLWNKDHTQFYKKITILILPVIIIIIIPGQPASKPLFVIEFTDHIEYYFLSKAPSTQLLLNRNSARSAQPTHLTRLVDGAAVTSNLFFSL